MDWKKYGVVISSNYRKKILISLLERPKMPKEISSETKIYLSHVSKTLNELETMSLVKCLTPMLKKGRVYALTSDGEEIAKYIKKYL